MYCYLSVLLCSDEFEFPLIRDTGERAIRGYVYVIDSGNHRVQKFDSNGKFIAKWGSKNSIGKVYQLKGIATDHSGCVYVADSSDDCVLVLRSKLD